MKEIKFRAWDKEAELWRYFTLEDLVFGKMRPFAHCIENVCRYVGTKDKNGKEIYEGDIVKCPKAKNGVTSIVYGDRPFENGGFYLNWKINGRPELTENTVYLFEIEVIGTIHENKDLLI